jgi:ubiquinone/menaquinone biosynthesis C-methylase UbiE
MNTEEVHSFYERDAANYDKRWHSLGGAATFTSQRNIVNELCWEWQGKDILEVGCGTGRFSLFLMEIGKGAALVDLSVEMLKVTQEKLQQNSLLPFSGTNASIYHLPFRAGTFDCVLTINVFNHLEMPSVALCELARVLKLGGKLVMNFANRYSYFWPAAFVITRRQRAISKGVFSSWLSRTEIARYLEDAGFRVIRTIGHVHIPPYLDKPLIRNIIYLLDSISRDSLLSFWAPILFLDCEKVRYDSTSIEDIFIHLQA